ncbi:MAG: hypothetical protein RIC87_06745 [Kiloniellales bacterium]
MDSLVLARAVHLLGLVHWIGGLAFVTLVVLPAARHAVPAKERLAFFERIEQRFASQARVSVTLVGLSGFAMTEIMDAWYRFQDAGFWWMHAMVLVWLLFTVMLFLAEPLFFDAWFHRRAERDPESAFAFMQRAHLILLSVSAITLAGAALGAHGVIF